MGYAAEGCYSGGRGTSSTIVLVLFILLVIITSAFVW
ncbi:YjcZ family sporulation protein [Paenibacillus marchantiophytorum]|nr:YjcZ family sporulation protein [Paenibacillus marchantiophytorum]